MGGNTNNKEIFLDPTRNSEARKGLQGSFVQAKKESVKVSRPQQKLLCRRSRNKVGGRYTEQGGHANTVRGTSMGALRTPEREERLLKYDWKSLKLEKQGYKIPSNSTNSEREPQREP